MFDRSKSFLPLYVVSPLFHPASGLGPTPRSSPASALSHSPAYALPPLLSHIRPRPHPPDFSHLSSLTRATSPAEEPTGQAQLRAPLSARAPGHAARVQPGGTIGGFESRSKHRPDAGGRLADRRRRGLPISTTSSSDSVKAFSPVGETHRLGAKTVRPQHQPQPIQTTAMCCLAIERATLAIERRALKRLTGRRTGGVQAPDWLYRYHVLNLALNWPLKEPQQPHRASSLTVWAAL